MKRCSMVANSFGKFLNLTKEELRILTLSAYFHDIGKLDITPILLYKPEITEEEFQSIKNHTLIKKEYIGKFSIFNITDKELLRSLLLSIQYHHERPDGKGYYKKNISYLPKIVKIVAIIDSYDVMVNKRSYKDEVKDLTEVITEFESLLGIQFDKEYGEKFIEYLKSIQ